MRSILPRGGRSDLLNCGWQRHSHRLEHLATRPLGLAPQQETLPVLIHLHHLQTIQVSDHVGPLQLVASLLQPGPQLLTEHQRQERTEHMAPDRLVTLVLDRAGLEQRLARPEPVLHRPEPLVLQRHLGGVQLGVGAEHPLAVVAGVLGDLRLIDPEAGGVTAAELTAVALVADQRLVPAAESLPQRRHDRLPIGGILAGLALVEPDHVAAAIDPDFLDLQR